MSKRLRKEKQRLEVQGLEPLHDRPIPAWERRVRRASALRDGAHRRNEGRTACEGPLTSPGDPPGSATSG